MPDITADFEKEGEISSDDASVDKQQVVTSSMPAESAPKTEPKSPVKDKKLAYLEKLKAMKFSKSKSSTIDFSIMAQSKPKPPPMKPIIHSAQNRDNREQRQSNRGKSQGKNFQDWDEPATITDRVVNDNSYDEYIHQKRSQYDYQRPLRMQRSKRQNEQQQRYDNEYYTFDDEMPPEDEYVQAPTTPPQPEPPPPLTDEEFNEKIKNVAIDINDIQRMTWNQLRDGVKQLKTMTHVVLKEINANENEIAKLQQTIQEKCAALNIRPDAVRNNPFGPNPNPIESAPITPASKQVFTPWQAFTANNAAPIVPAGLSLFSTPAPTSTVDQGLSLFAPLAPPLFTNSQTSKNDITMMSATKLVDSLMSTVLAPKQSHSATLTQPPMPPPMSSYVISAPPAAPTMATTGVVVDTSRANLVPVDRQPKARVTLKSRGLRRKGSNKPSMLGNKVVHKAQMTLAHLEAKRRRQESAKDTIEKESDDIADSVIEAPDEARVSQEKPLCVASEWEQGQKATKLAFSVDSLHPTI